MKFLDVKTDFAFKKVFGSEESKDLLLSFLNAVLYSEGARHIADLTIVDPYSVPLLKGMKDTYVDVKAKLDDGSQVIIEMQVLNHAGLEKRVLYNAAKHYSVQLQQGEQYSLLNPVVALTIVDFSLFDVVPKDVKPSPYLSRFKLLETQTLTEYNGDIELVFIELPKFTAAQDQLQALQDKWIYFIKNAGSLQLIPSGLNASPDLQRAFDLVNEANMTPSELEAQHKRKEFIMIQRTAVEKATDDGLAKGMEQGITKGLEEGMVLKAQEIARAMLANGLDAEMVTKLSGLTSTQVTALQA